MNITDKDKRLLEDIAHAYGDQFREFLDRFISSTCDSREWGDGVEKTHANFAAKRIEALRSMLKPKSASTNEDDWE